LDAVGLGEQEVFAGRRSLSRRKKGGRRWEARVGNVTQRLLPSGSSALDVSVVITGDYRPPPYIDLNVIAEDSINRQGEKVISSLQERGSRAGRSFFERVEGIEATAKEALTERPTRAPTGKPSPGPTGLPTAEPSLLPSALPSDQPSAQPSRALEQTIVTGSSQDLQLGGTTTSSYGYLFNLRTKPTSPVVQITSLEFYTESTQSVNYEVWTREGSFKDFKGSYEGWTLIAEGSVEGRGLGRYTQIPDDTFTPVSIRGGGGEDGTRAFYITLDSKELIYKLGNGPDSDVDVHASSAELEVYEGEGVLTYPFPAVAEISYYRYPRQYLGTIHYDRLPCKPYSVFGHVMDLPCPDMPTSSPTPPQPTRNPVTPPPSTSPVTEPPMTPAPIIAGVTLSPIPPTMVPTLTPTISSVPSASPTTQSPTSSPIVPMRAYIVSIFRNAPERDMTSREIEKFLEITTEFLRRHTQSSMVIEGVEIWHQKLTLADAKEGSVTWEEEEEEEEEEDGEAEQEDLNVFPVDEGEQTTGMSMSPSIRRRLNDKKNFSKGQLKHEQKVDVPKVTAVEITLIIKISVSTLPENLLGNMAAVAMNENQVELLSLLNEQAAFYTYFKHMDGIQSNSVDFVTKAPTLSPTTYQFFLSNQVIETDVETVPEESEGSKFMVFVGLGVAALWCCLTGISLTYLYKVRARMNEENELKELLSQEKVNPLDTKKEENTKDVNDQWRENGLSNEPDMENQDVVSKSSTLTDSMRDDDADVNAELLSSAASRNGDKLRPSTGSKSNDKKNLKKGSSIRKLDLSGLRDSGSKVISLAGNKITASKGNRPKLVTMRSTSLRTSLGNLPPPKKISRRTSDVGARPTFERTVVVNQKQSHSREQPVTSKVSRRSSDNGYYPSDNGKEEISSALSIRVQPTRPNTAGTRFANVQSGLGPQAPKMIATRRSSDDGYDPSPERQSAGSVVSRRFSDNGSSPANGKDNAPSITSSKRDSRSRPNIAGMRPGTARTGLVRPTPTKTSRRASFDGINPSYSSMQGGARRNAPKTRRSSDNGCIPSAEFRR